MDSWPDSTRPRCEFVDHPSGGYVCVNCDYAQTTDSPRFCSVDPNSSRWCQLIKEKFGWKCRVCGAETNDNERRECRGGRPSNFGKVKAEKLGKMSASEATNARIDELSAALSAIGVRIEETPLNAFTGERTLPVFRFVTDEGVPLKVEWTNAEMTRMVGPLLHPSKDAWTMMNRTVIFAICDALRGKPEKMEPPTSAEMCECGHSQIQHYCGWGFCTCFCKEFKSVVKGAVYRTGKDAPCYQTHASLGIECTRCGVIKETCNIVEYDGAYKCLTHKKQWGKITTPDQPCAGWKEK